ISVDRCTGTGNAGGVSEVGDGGGTGIGTDRSRRSRSFCEAGKAYCGKDKADRGGRRPKRWCCGRPGGALLVAESQSCTAACRSDDYRQINRGAAVRGHEREERSGVFLRRAVGGTHRYAVEGARPTRARPYLLILLQGQ